MCKFSRAESWRIGVGMMPRGEVALIMGGVAFGQGLIGQDLFSVCIIMTIITTLLAPLILVRSFKNKST